MQNNKTFRLFISSTFNDFRREREVLQTKVFPHIKQFASQKGFTFQPIDLRWGVSNEAQLDQKTLELCLTEVRSCKSHIHPNFLIMIGDRYGWIPLPYCIETHEFEVLTTLMDEKDKASILQWYTEDLNQLPTAYILKERTGIYEAFTQWTDVENSLRTIFQIAVTNSNLTSDQKRKYFISATEAEVEEGIIPYIKPTTYHEKELLSHNPTLAIVDPEHIFGFFRDIDKTSQIDNKFIVDDYDEAQAFKVRVRDVLKNENSLHVNTIQTNKDSLEESYLEAFEKQIIEFLESQITYQKDKEKKAELTLLDIELQAQRNFAQNKRKDFLGQEKLRTSIANYTTNDNDEPLVLYGSSGKGKSSLMAKVIQEVQEKPGKKVMYRFVGATAHSGTSIEIWTSIFEELGTKIDAQEKSFEQFSEHVYKEILNIKEDVVICIDAVDQLDHDEQFLWLPTTLPLNVKIVISTLNDEHYKEDSKYFNVLQNITTTLLEIHPFNEPKSLLKNLLEIENRTIQKNQEDYFLQQYQTANSPLYIAVAMQELKNWKSYDVVEGKPPIGGRLQSLQATNRHIIEEFIYNLIKLFHHNEAFVYKVLGYIYATRDGLSENELLQLISANEMFVQKISPDTFHKNLTKELPLVLWSRLHSQIKSFLSQSKQDNEEVMYFFHREFEDVIKTLPMQQLEHDDLIKSTQTCITQTKAIGFNSNRFGKLYATIITEYDLRYNDKAKQKEFATFITELGHMEWINSYLDNVKQIGLLNYEHNRMYKSIAYQESYLRTTEILNTTYPDDYKDIYNAALKDLATTYKYQNRQDKARELEEHSLILSKKLYSENPSKYGLDYSETLTNLARSLYNQNRLEEAVTFEKEALEICKYGYEEDSDVWAYNYSRTLINLARTYYNFNKLKDAIVLLEDALTIRTRYYKKDPLQWVGYYTIVLNDLAFSYKDQNRHLEAIPLEEEALSIRKKLYQSNPTRWPKDYTRSLNNLSASYKYQNLNDKAMVLEEESYSITKALYEDNPERWGKDYTITLDNLSTSYRDNNRLGEAIKLQEKSLTICASLYKNDPARWVEFYTRALNNVAISYTQQKEFKKAIELEELSYKINKDLYYKTPDRWQRDYARALNNLAQSYKNQNRLNEAIALEEVSLAICKAYFLDDADRWVDIYTRALRNLATSHLYQENNSKKSLELQEELIRIYEPFVAKNPAHWSDIYTKAVENYKRY